MEPAAKIITGELVPGAAIHKPNSGTPPCTEGWGNSHQFCLTPRTHRTHQIVFPTHCVEGFWSLASGSISACFEAGIACSNSAELSFLAKCCTFKIICDIRKKNIFVFLVSLSGSFAVQDGLKWKWAALHLHSPATRGLFVILKWVWSEGELFKLILVWICQNKSKNGSRYSFHFLEHFRTETWAVLSSAPKSIYFILRISSFSSWPISPEFEAFCREESLEDLLHCHMSQGDLTLWLDHPIHGLFFRCF